MVTLPAMLLLVAAAEVPGKEVVEEPSPPTAQWEVTPFIGYRAGGTFDVPGFTESADIGEHVSYGLAVDYLADAGMTYEVFYSRQPTRVDLVSQPGQVGLDVEYVLFGGSWVFKETSRVRPYLVALIGFGRFSLDTPSLDDEIRFAVSLGAGLRVPLRKHLDLRLETRGYATYVGSDSLFCRTVNGEKDCQYQGSGSVLPQIEVLAGVAWSF